MVAVSAELVEESMLGMTREGGSVFLVILQVSGKVVLGHRSGGRSMRQCVGIFIFTLTNSHAAAMAGRSCEIFECNSQ